MKGGRFTKTQLISYTHQTQIPFTVCDRSRDLRAQPAIPFPSKGAYLKYQRAKIDVILILPDKAP